MSARRGAGRLLRAWYQSVDPVLAHMREAGLLPGPVETAATRVLFLLSELDRRRRVRDARSTSRAIADLHLRISALDDRIVALAISLAPRSSSPSPAGCSLGEASSGDAVGDALDREAIRREAGKICDEHVRVRGGTDRLALALAVADGLVDQIEREVGVALDRAGKAQDRAERDVREFHEENIALRDRADEDLRVRLRETSQLRDRIAQLEESARDNERTREEDQRRRDELDRFPGAGAG